MRALVVGMIALAAVIGPRSGRAIGNRQSEIGNHYIVYVVSEAADRISVVRFTPQDGRLEREITTGAMPNEIDGPHGIAVSPDGRSYFVSLAHGQPFGSVLKYSTKDDKVTGQVTLGMFPASLQVSPDGEFFYIVNFNLHGDMVPSSVSVVATEPMLEVARIQTCTMPHGSRLNPQGTKHYSACMMDDALVEIDTATLKVSRHVGLARGKEHGGAGAPPATLHRGHGAAHKPDCSPTWAQPSADGRRVFVACNASHEIVEVDVEGWKIARRIPARPGVYNLAVTRDGKIIATNKRDKSVSVFDGTSGKALAHLKTRRGVVHGVVVSADDRYAFVSVEGIAAEPGTVEMIDLAQLKIVASVDVAPQAAGIDVVR